MNLKVAHEAWMLMGLEVFKLHTGWGVLPLRMKYVPPMYHGKVEEFLKTYIGLVELADRIEGRHGRGERTGKDSGSNGRGTREGTDPSPRLQPRLHTRA